MPVSLSVPGRLPVGGELGQKSLDRTSSGTSSAQSRKPGRAPVHRSLTMGRRRQGTRSAGEITPPFYGASQAEIAVFASRDAAFASATEIGRSPVNMIRKRFRTVAGV